MGGRQRSGESDGGRKKVGEHQGAQRVSESVGHGWSGAKEDGQPTCSLQP